MKFFKVKTDFFTRYSWTKTIQSQCEESLFIDVDKNGITFNFRSSSDLCFEISRPRFNILWNQMFGESELTNPTKIIKYYEKKFEEIPLFE